MQVQSLGLEYPLEEGMATHSSILAWRIPRTEEPGGLKSMGSKRVGNDWSNLAHIHKKDYYSAIKESETNLLVGMWMNLEPVIQCKVSQKEKNKYHILMHICAIQENGISSVQSLSHVRLFATPWIAAHQASLSKSAVATGLKKVSFHSNRKERQCQIMLKLLHNCTHFTC